MSNNLGLPPRHPLADAFLLAAGIDPRRDALKNAAERSGSFADKVRYFESLPPSADAIATKTGATMQRKQPSPAELFEQGLHDEKHRSEAARNATAAAHDPKRDYAANFTYALPSDAASKLGDDPTRWHEEANAMSLQHRFTSGMKLNAQELMMLGLNQTRTGRAAG